MNKSKTVDEYIKQTPKDVQSDLKILRKTILENAPNAEEKISYGMPSFNFKGSYLVYFAGYKNHIGFYPVPTGIEAFKKELSVYKTGRGSVQFPLDKPMPLNLITKIVKFRVKENLQKVKTKKK